VLEFQSHVAHFLNIGTEFRVYALKLLWVGYLAASGNDDVLVMTVDMKNWRGVIGAN
jgi:hypothetical protein